MRTVSAAACAISRFPDIFPAEIFHIVVDKPEIASDKGEPPVFRGIADGIGVPVECDYPA